MKTLLSAVVLSSISLSYGAEGTVKLSKVIQSLHQKINHLSLEECGTLKSDYRNLLKLDFNQVDTSDLKLNHALISKEAFAARIDLRHRMRAWETTSSLIPATCVSTLRDTFRALRYLEETVAVKANPQAPYNENHVAPYLSGSAPFLQINPDFGKLEFPRDLKSGDLLVSRGNAPTSALIARLGDTDGQFSHLAMVFVHPISKNVYVMEEHIEVGSAVRRYQTYAADHNFRVTVYRHKDETLARKAAEHMFKALYDPNNPHVIPYDFGMVMDDAHELFCSEVAYEGFKRASHGSVRIGKYRTSFHPKNRDLLDRFGVRTTSMFAPSDMELEPQFEVLAEWRDLSRVVSNQMMDAILTKILEWGDLGYSFYPSNTMTVKANAGHLLRLMGFNKDELPTNMPVSTIQTVLALDPTVNALLGSLEKFSNRFKLLTGNYLTFNQMFLYLENLRQEDLRRYEQGENTLFHEWFHP